MSGDSAELDPVSLSALLASRVCHDLINPIGALGSGLEVLDDPAMDESMRQAALDLVRTGGEKAVAVLKYARIAYGAAGGFGAELSMDEAETVLREVYKWTKAELVWSAPAGLAAKDKVKVLLILGYAAADCVPRGGTVTIRLKGLRLTVAAEGARVILQDEFAAALGGDPTEIKPKFAPAYIAGMIVRQEGGEIAVALEDGKVVMEAKFNDAPVLAQAR